MSANSNPFKIIKTRATSVLYGELMSAINKTNELFGINIKKIMSLVGEEYSVYLNAYREEARKILDDKYGRDLDAVRKDTERFMSILDNIWAMKNGNEFVIDVDKAYNLPEVKDINSVDFDILGDSFISFTTGIEGKRDYTSLYSSFMRLEEKVSTRKYKDMSLYAITVGLAGNNGITYQIHFTKELYPRFIKISELEKCRLCTKKNIFKNSLGTACLIGGLQREDCLPFKYPFTPTKMLNVFAYISRMFKDRNNLIRKNSKNIREYRGNAEIRVVCTKDRKDVEVPLLLYAKGENVEYIPRKGTKHASHSSPREHIRREHTRTLKSGKVVNVKSSVVNKGKGKVIYKVD